MNLSVDIIVQLVMGLGVIPGLFVYLLMDTRKEHRERLAESIAREQKLMEHIAQSDRTQQEITNSIAQISGTMTGIEKSLTFVQRDIEELKKG